MTIGYIGLGKMGKNMVLRLLEKGHKVIVWNRTSERTNEVVEAGAERALTIEELVDAVRQKTDGAQPATFWIMLPAGDATELMVNQLALILKKGEIIIDGANGFYKDSVRRSKELHKKGIHYIDAAISGGPSGARNGACVMLGGDKEQVEQLYPLWESISRPQGFSYFGKSGAGHFVKMVHNGIEYGMMQAIGEGFEVLKKSEFDLDLEEVCRLYNTGSVIESRLVGWLQSGYQTYGQDLTEISGSIKHSGEGQWTVETAKEMEIPVPVIEKSLQFRIDSEQKPSYTGQVVSTLRNQFGGHEVKKDA